MKVHVYLKAENLQPGASGGGGGGWFSASKKAPNTFVDVSAVTGVGSVLGIKRRRLCVTEVVTQTSSPEWTTIPMIDFKPRSEQRIAIDIFQKLTKPSKNIPIIVEHKESHEKGYHGKEHRGTATDFKDAQHVTGVVVSVDEVLSSPNATIVQETNTGGKVYVHMEISSDPDDQSQFVFQLRGVNFPKRKPTDFFQFEILCKYTGQTEEQLYLVYRSPKEKANTPDPLWEMEYIPVATLCNQDLNRDLLLRLVSVDGTGRRALLGFVPTNIHALEAAVSHHTDVSRGFTLVDKNGNDANVGQVVVLRADVQTPMRLDPSPSSLMLTQAS